MSDDLFVGQGTIYKLKQGDYSTDLRLTLPELNILPSSRVADVCDNSVILVQSVQVAKSAVVTPVVGVDKKRILYTFGENFGNIVIKAIILTGGSHYNGAEPKGIIDAWDNISLTNSETPCNMKWAGTEYKVYISGIIITTVDTELGILGVDIPAIIAPVTNKN